VSNAQTFLCSSGVIPEIDELRYVKPNYKEIKESTFKIDFEKSSSFLSKDATRFIHRTKNVIGFDLLPKEKTLNNLSGNIDNTVKSSFCDIITKKILSKKLFVSDKEYKLAVEKLSKGLKECVFKEASFDGYAFTVSVNIPDYDRKPKRKIKMWTNEIVLIPFIENGNRLIRFFSLNRIVGAEIYIEGKMAARVIAGSYNKNEEIEESKKWLKRINNDVCDYNIENGKILYPLKRKFINKPSY